MTNYDDLFTETTPTNSVFADKAALDPLADPTAIRGRDEQERQLATILNGIHDGYLPPTVSIHGPPGTGKTATVRRVCREFAARTDDVAVEYVNLKDCRSIFGVARELHLELIGDSVPGYEGLDGAFKGIWAALEEYPAWTVLVLDEIDQLQHDTNYDPSEFLYRLLRGEGKLARDIQVSAWLISNQLLEVDLRLDSRVESAMGDETVFFPPYDQEDLAAVVGPRLDRAFRAGTLPEAVRTEGIAAAARRWGDARKTLRLFRRAGERANENAESVITQKCIEKSMTETDREATITKLKQLPVTHLAVLAAGVSRRRGGEIVQPTTTERIYEVLNQPSTRAALQVGRRRIREIVTDLETMGLVDTWLESQGRGGRRQYLETTFDPEWVREAQADIAETSNTGDDSTSAS